MGLRPLGVDGLEVIIAEAGIDLQLLSGENGLVTKPRWLSRWGFWLTCWIDLLVISWLGDYIHWRWSSSGRFLEKVKNILDHLRLVTTISFGMTTTICSMLLCSSWSSLCMVLQDWNQTSSCLPDVSCSSKLISTNFLFSIHGAHVYMNNWQSIDCRSWMQLLSMKLLGLDSSYQLLLSSGRTIPHPQTWRETW